MCKQPVPLQTCLALRRRVLPAMLVAGAILAVASSAVANQAGQKEAPANAPEKSAPEKSAPEKSAPEKSAPEKSGPEKTTAEAPAAEAAGHGAVAAAQPAGSAEHAAGSAEHAAAGQEAAPQPAHEAAHGGAHHDPTDLSHQNAGPMLEDPSQWKSDLAIGTLLVFLGLLILLTKFAWRPIMEGLEKREAAIAANIEQAQRSADQATAQLRHYEAKLAAAAEEAREIVNQARKDADAARERIVAEAQAAAQRERQRAVEDIATAKNVALQEMTQKSVDLAVALAGRMVRRQLQPEDHAQLVREVLEQFPSPN